MAVSNGDRSGTETGEGEENGDAEDAEDAAQEVTDDEDADKDSTDARPLSCSFLCWTLCATRLVSFLMRSCVVSLYPGQGMRLRAH